MKRLTTALVRWWIQSSCCCLRTLCWRLLQDRGDSFETLTEMKLPEELPSYTIKTWNEPCLILGPLQGRTCKDVLRSTDSLSSSVLLLDLASVNRSALALSLKGDASDSGKCFTRVAVPNFSVRLTRKKWARASKPATWNVEAATCGFCQMTFGLLNLLTDNF